MGRPKGGKNRYWSKEEKLKYVKRLLEGESSSQIMRDENISKGMLSQWLKKYREGGIEELENKRKPGNPLAKYSNKKELTDLEKLQYENMKLKIENLRLKKGYTEKDVIKARKK
ncbi:helix-turn-helix domain-containing protein [Mycoplasmatota bacterium zrk1]